MFTDETFEAVGFDSQVSVAKPEVSANVQTTEIAYSSNETQTIEKRNAATQTVQAQVKKPFLDIDKLADFLKKASPIVFDAIEEAYTTTAFDDYEPETTSNPSIHLQLLQKLNAVEESDKETKISSLLWSIAGGTLAVSCSAIQHLTWCDHRSKIQLYSLSREDKFSDSPNEVLDVHSCVTTLSYHPVEPSILASGLFNGDVIVWNLRNDTITSIQVCTHGDAVSHIYWKPRTMNDVSFLVSSSRDGYIMVHKIMANFTTPRLHKRFKIIKEHNPIWNSRPRSAGGTHERATEAGLCITSFDFSWKDPTIFIAGTSCGGIYKCSLDRGSPIEGDENVSDPVIDEYDRHKGSITCVKSSPTRNLFVTCSTDKEITIYHFEQCLNLQTISLGYTVTGMTWMVCNDNIFATFGAGPTINFYDVTTGKAVTNLKIESTSGLSTSSLCVNSERDMLAIGDVRGNVEVWKIPRELFLD